MTREVQTVAEVTQAVHEGRVGHAEAMRKLGLSTFNELVATMHANGLSLWAHRPDVRSSTELMNILAAACARPTVRG